MPRSSTVLLVEDDPDDELLTLQALRQRTDLDIQVVRDGQEALDYLLHEGAWQTEAPALPDFCLLDLNLPRVGGHEVLRRLRGHRRTRSLPIVVLSSSIDEADVAGAYDAGANGYVRKHVDFDAFCKSVQALAAFWFDTNQGPPARA